MSSISQQAQPVSHSQIQNLRVNKSLIEPLLNQPKRIRNVCILAHVDHGNRTGRLNY